MRRNVSTVKYELGSYIPEDGIPHSHRRENLKSVRALNHGLRAIVPDGASHNFGEISS
jgi:hypothetical protein